MLKNLRLLARFFSPVLAFAIGCVTMLLYIQLRVAHAAAVLASAVPDPTPALTSATDAGWSTLMQDGPWWLGIAIVHVALRLLLDKEHALLQGKVLAGLSALAGVLTAVIAWHWQGAPAAGIVTAAIAGFTLLVHPAPNAQPATVPARNSQAGFARWTLLAWLACGAIGVAWVAVASGTLSLTGCTNPKVQAVEKALWDCTAPERADAVNAITPTVISVIKAAGSADGKLIDTSTVRSAITKANVMSEAGILLSCALASAVAILETPAPAPAPGAPAASPYALDPAAVARIWADVKASQLGNAGFVVAGGRVL
jgi:hypothetical protein